MIRGDCMCFYVVLLGRPGIGKTTLSLSWQCIDSFVTYLGGAPCKLTVPHPLPPTEYVDIRPLDIVVRQCTEAALHRVYIVDCPGDERKRGLVDGFLEGRTLQDGVDAAILLIDSQDLESAARREIDLCGQHGVELVIVLLGHAVPQEWAAPPHVHVLCCEKDDLIAMSRALVDLIELVHAKKKARLLEDRTCREELDSGVRLAQSKKHGKSLPSRKISGKIVATAAPPDPNGIHIRVALCGAANSGKSTFMTCMLDGLVLRDYEPTTAMEVGTFAFELSDGRRVHVTMFDGPGAAELPRLAILIVFVNASTVSALEDAAHEVAEVALPPLTCVITTKTDVGSLVAFEDLDAFAGQLGAHVLENIDCRTDNTAFLSLLILQMLDGNAAVHRRATRYVELLVQKREAEDCAYTNEQLRSLFNQYDPDGNGFVTLQQAEALFRAADRTQLWDAKEAVARILEKYRHGHGGDRVTYEQFCIFMCELARM